MKIDTSLWNNEKRLRERVRNLAQLVLSVTALNSFILYTHESWFILGINVFFFVMTLPVFISYSKWKKEPPKVNKKEDTEFERYRKSKANNRGKK